jgi:hypothetical protein
LDRLPPVPPFFQMIFTEHLRTKKDEQDDSSRVIPLDGLRELKRRLMSRSSWHQTKAPLSLPLIWSSLTESNWKVWTLVPRRRPKAEANEFHQPDLHDHG